MQTVIQLTQQLVAIPSWVGKGCDEQTIGEFIYRWLKENTQLTVVKQPVQNGRFNVIAFDNSPPRLLLVGHLDTVETRAGWVTDPFVPTLRNDRLYGLGATDMKGSLAAGLVALANSPNTRGLMFLAYCDEEYDFAGMRAFVAEYADKIQPERIVSLDGSYGQIGIGCRGLIEVNFKLRGKTGHAGRPELGVNAITAGVNLITKLKRQLATKYSDPVLGPTSLNLAYCQGGLDLGNGNFGRQGNNIADFAEFILDIRPALPSLTASRVQTLIQSYLPGSKLQLENYTVRHDLGSWLTPPDQLASLNLPGTLAPSLGYIDTQMLWETFGEVPCLTVGAGNLALAHMPNEYVETVALTTTQTLVARLINQP